MCTFVKMFLWLKFQINFQNIRLFHILLISYCCHIWGCCYMFAQMWTNKFLYGIFVYILSVLSLPSYYLFHIYVCSVSSDVDKYVPHIWLHLYQCSCLSFCDVPHLPICFTYHLFVYCLCLVSICHWYLVCQTDSFIFWHTHTK